RLLVPRGDPQEVVHNIQCNVMSSHLGHDIEDVQPSIVGVVGVKAHYPRYLILGNDQLGLCPRLDIWHLDVLPGSAAPAEPAVLARLGALLHKRGHDPIILVAPSLEKFAPSHPTPT